MRPGWSCPPTLFTQELQSAVLENEHKARIVPEIQRCHRLRVRGFEINQGFTLVGQDALGAAKQAIARGKLAVGTDVALQTILELNNAKPEDRKPKALERLAKLQKKKVDVSGAILSLLKDVSK